MEKLQINYEVLHSIYGEINEEVIDLFNCFIDSNKEIISNLQHTYEIGAVEDYRRCLHHNASPYTYVGFPEVTDTFKLMETKSKCISSISEITQEHELLVQKVIKVAIILKEEINKMLLKNKHVGYKIAC